MVSCEIVIFFLLLLSLLRSVLCFFYSLYVSIHYIHFTLLFFVVWSFTIFSIKKIFVWIEFYFLFFHPHQQQINTLHLTRGDCTERMRWFFWETKHLIRWWLGIYTVSQSFGRGGVKLFYDEFSHDEAFDEERFSIDKLARCFCDLWEVFEYNWNFFLDIFQIRVNFI